MTFEVAQLAGVDVYLQKAFNFMGTGTGWGNDVIVLTLQRFRYDFLNAVVDHPRIDLFNRLMDSYEAGQANPTEDNPKVTSETLFEAARFLEKLPADIPTPDVDTTPDAEIMFTWSKDKDQSYIASFNGKGLVYFAGLFGHPNTRRGRETFGQCIPQTVLIDLRRLYGLPIGA
jgi:hypothetical protein